LGDQQPTWPPELRAQRGLAPALARAAAAAGQRRSCAAAAANPLLILELPPASSERGARRRFGTASAPRLAALGLKVETVAATLALL
jgi:hypothetical protein